MRKKYHSLEEVRRAAAERQKRWRENNKVLARERVAYVYGKAKYPEMVEAHRRGGPKAPSSAINEPSITHKEAPKVEDELKRVPIDEAEGDPKVMLEHRQRMQRFRPPVAPLVRNLSAERVVTHKDTEVELKAKEDLVGLVNRKKREKEMEVPFE